MKPQPQVIPMKRKTKGLSTIVIMGLLILIGIVLAVGMYSYTKRYTKGSDVVTASAVVNGNSWVNGKPVYQVKLTLQSKAKTRLQVDTIRAIGTLKDGTAVNTAFTGGTGTLGSGRTTYYQVQIVPAPRSNDAWLTPGSQKDFVLMFTGTDANHAIHSLSFQIVLKDDSGNTYTVQTGEVTFG